MPLLLPGEEWKNDPPSGRPTVGAGLTLVATSSPWGEGHCHLLREACRLETKGLAPAPGPSALPQRLPAQRNPHAEGYRLGQSLDALFSQFQDLLFKCEL